MFKYLAKRHVTNVSIKQSLEKLGIRCHEVFHNLTVAELYEKEIQFNNPMDTSVSKNMITSSGALAAYSGVKTGRSPKDKRIVLDNFTEKEIWWGDINMPITPKTFKMLESRSVDYLSSRPRLYIVDGYAGWDPKFRIKVRVVASRSYHAHFMRNMLIVPTKEELSEDFNQDPDYVILNSGEMNAGLYEGVTSKTCVSLNFSERKLVILGTQYAGEMKKGVFSIMNYLMPKRGILSMHTSANEGEKGDVTLLFGLSGTGKTTLSADVKRRLIGDDEHCWSEDGIFNIEGGCYAKCVGLNKEKEPEIYNAVRYGSVLENIKFKDLHTREVDYNDISITENTRVSYPLDFIPGAKIPAIAGHPKNIFFLTCDAYGVLPPVSKLTHEQAMYHFISGYTAKVAGTEMGIKEPQSTFSACFGEAFLPLHPTIYAELLAKKMKAHGTNAWLINTGWSGGKYGVGKRMDITTTRRIIDAIHDGTLQNIKTKKTPIFNLNIPENCPGLDSKLLNPIETWQNKEEYNMILKQLATSFQDNFKKYSDKASDEIKNAGPVLH
jgi:phosphoenolpyruvate carboxykinase (ATP)